MFSENCELHRETNFLMGSKMTVFHLPEIFIRDWLQEWSLVEITQCSLYSTVTKLSSTNPAAVRRDFLLAMNFPPFVKVPFNRDFTLAFQLH